MGTNYIAPTWRQPENTNKDRLSNYSLYFDGSGHEIDCGTGDEVNITGPISISVWFNADNTDGARGIVCKNDAAAQQTFAQYFFDLLSNEIRWRAGRSTVTYGINASQWYHAVGTFDGSNIKLYIDGGEVATSVAAVDSYASAQPMYIGRRLSQAYFEGEIGQVCIFDYAIDQDQITYLYNLNNPLTISGAEPIAYWPLGDNSNPTANAGYPNIISDADSVFEFDGSTDYIDTPQIDLGVNSSITTWYKPANNSYALFGEATSGFDYLVSQQSGSFIVWMGSAIGNIMNFGGAISSNIIFNEWNFLAIVKTGDSVTVYLNNSDGEFSSTVTNVNVAGLSLKFDRIGARTLATPTLYYDGEISNILGFKTSLSSTEVSTVYNNGLPLLELSEIPQKDDLMVWYKLNQSAVLTPGTPTNWTITKIGSPNFSGTNDGSYAGTSGTSPYNSGLIWHDNNSGATVGSDYFQWNSPTIYTSGSNIVLSSSGGSWVTPSSGGNQAILEYNIDDGSWVTWHTQTNGIDGFATNNFTIPSTGNLTVSNNIKIRIKGVDFGSTGSYLKINDINATGGTSSYNESFTNATRYGFSGGGESQPPATFSADKWDIPDNRSAFPQSFDFKAADSSFFNSGDILHNDGQTPMSVTGWVKITTAAASSNSAPIASKKRIRSAPTYSMDGWEVTFISSGASLNKLYFSYVTNGVSATGSITKKALSKAFTDGLWHHVAVTYDGSGNADGVKFYVDGDEDTSTQTLSNNLSGSMPNDPSADFLIGKTPKYGGFNYMDGDMSNIQIWDSKLESSDVLNLYNNGVPLPTTSVEPSNLKAWYKLNVDEIWENVAQQWRVKNNQITPINYDRAGQSNLAFGGGYFNYVTTTNLTQSRTISLWIKYDINRQTGTLRVGFFNNPSLTFHTTGFREINQASSGVVTFTVPGINVSDGGWHHILLHTIGDSADASNIAYIDGQLATRSVIGTNSYTFGNPGVGYSNKGGNLPPAAYSFSNLVMYNGDATSNVNALYNNGTPPADVSSTTPDVWWKTNSTNSSVTTLEDFSGNNNDSTTTYTQPVNMVTDNWIAESGISSGMTEANLIDENVSVVNGESDTLPGTALVQSDLTRKLPFSNYSINFDTASGDYMQVPDPGGSVLAYGENKFSFSGWINPTTFVNQGGLIGRYKNTTSRTTIKGSYQNGFDGLMFQSVEDPSAPNFHITWDNILTANEWQHVCLVYDGANTSCVMYINGVDQGAGVITGAIPTSLPDFSGYPIDIAVDAMNGLNNRNYDGKFSNFSIFDSILTQEEVLDLYNNGIPSNLNTSFTPGNPEAWWPMDQNYTYFDGSVLVARDAVNSKDATGANVIQENIVGNAPGSEANGVGSNLTIADLKGDMQNSTNNSYSINMADYADGVTNPADSGRSTNVP